jgi:hypothetical protein
VSTIDWTGSNPIALSPELPGTRATDVPQYFISPARGKRDTRTHRFFRSVWDPTRGLLLPERVANRRHAEQFFHRIHEARALLDLREVAESLAFSTRTDPNYGTAARMRQKVDKYLATFEMVRETSA